MPACRMQASACVISNSHSEHVNCWVYFYSVRIENADRGEVTERLKVLASKASVGETPPWVRIPPSPPFSILCFLSVRATVLALYPFCTFLHRVILPGAAHIRFELFLSRPYPRVVVFLGNS